MLKYHRNWNIISQLLAHVSIIKGPKQGRVDFPPSSSINNSDDLYCATLGLGEAGKVKCAHFKARIHRSRETTGMATRNETPRTTEVKDSSFCGISFGIDRHISISHLPRSWSQIETLTANEKPVMPLLGSEWLLPRARWRRSSAFSFHHPRVPDIGESCVVAPREPIAV